MIRMIFRNTILVGATVLVLCAALFFGLDYTHTKEEACEALRDEAVYAEQGLMLSGAPKWTTRLYSAWQAAICSPQHLPAHLKR